MSKSHREAVEKEALRLYDKLNPEPDKCIRVSKAECLRRAAQTTPPKQGR